VDVIKEALRRCSSDKHNSIVLGKAADRSSSGEAGANVVISSYQGRTCC
jgi:hypothetical protein